MPLGPLATRAGKPVAAGAGTLVAQATAGAGRLVAEANTEATEEWEAVANTEATVEWEAVADNSGPSAAGVASYPVLGATAGACKMAPLNSKDPSSVAGTWSGPSHRLGQ